MKKSATVFLQIIVILIGLAVLTFLLWEPHLEGRNINATTFEIYFKDPFLAYAYAGSIAFFVGVYKAFKLLGYVRQNKTFSQGSVKALRTIKYCALTIIAFVTPAVGYLIFVRPGDDIAGGVAMGVFIIFVSAIITTTAVVFERIVQNAVAIKQENDLTV